MTKLFYPAVFRNASQSDENEIEDVFLVDMSEYKRKHDSKAVKKTLRKVF